MFRGNHRNEQYSVAKTVCWRSPQKDYDADYDNDDHDDDDDDNVDDKYSYSNKKWPLDFTYSVCTIRKQLLTDISSR